MCKAPAEIAVDAYEPRVRGEGFLLYIERRAVAMFHQLWAHWKVIERTIGNFQSRVLLSIFYFFFLAPFGVGVRLSSDPLRLQRQYRSHWQPKENSVASIADSARRQF
jgi:hypothetical protein